MSSISDCRNLVVNLQPVNSLNKNNDKSIGSSKAKSHSVDD